jgi:hypothetical protein
MGESGRNGDVNGPTTAKPRGDLPGYGDGLPGRATVGATARRNHCRNPVLLVDRGGGSAVHLEMRDVYAVGDEWGGRGGPQRDAGAGGAEGGDGNCIAPTSVCARCYVVSRFPLAGTLLRHAAARFVQLDQ